ncbi:MAG: NADH-quinone oxidoreductase subunit L, partial [Chloroflexi bacterium]|nr:NADH-quinone oxidoreductase subunit L [Chloroflexota bacterium]
FPLLADLLDQADGTTYVAGEKAWEWLSFDLSGAGETFNIEIGFYVDPITIVMLAVVTLIALMVQVYSIAYMKGDSRYGWYFTAMSLFAASMLTLVLANNLLLLYAGWEAVGFCSLLLIGFWYEKRSAAEAAKKAFITTRIGDVGLLIGIIMLWIEGPNTFNIQEIIAFAEGGGYETTYLTAAVLFLFMGALGKSGQFPLHVWLPDAMEGPTPVSALIHAATMVVAGVYLVARMLPLFELADPIALDIVLVVGLITVMISATMGLAATDIKRVIAYSTLNSLGLMFVALGSSAVTAAMLYLFVHAFFKALLFLGAGSVIHATEEQDMNRLGGLAAKMPITAAMFAIGTLAMIGIIPLSGFWAKDEVLAVTREEQHIVVYLVLLSSLFITGLYMTRLFVRTFLFAPREQEVYDRAHENGLLITVPLLILGLLATVGGFVVFDEVGEALGFAGGFGQFVFLHEAHGFEFHLDVAVTSTVLAGGGVVFGWFLWRDKAELAASVRDRFAPISTLLANRYYIDEIYQFAIDHIVLGAGALIAWFDRVVVNDAGVNGSANIGYLAGFEAKFLQTGRLPNYALAIVAGILLLSVVMLVALV